MKYVGIFAGGLYAFLFRALAEFGGSFFTVYSISFLVGVAFLMGCVPLFFSSRVRPNIGSRQFTDPLVTAFCFFGLTWLFGWDDVVSLLIIGLPFCLMALITGIIGLRWKDQKLSPKWAFFLLLPLIFYSLEHLLPLPLADYQIKSKAIVHNSPAAIWPHLIAVPEISAEEYEAGFFSLVGIPRPIKSQLEVIDGKTYRVGYFSDELKLVESIVYQDSLKAMHFSIHLDKSVLRDVPMDKHILGSGFFHFFKIAYELEPIASSQTQLSLSCDYSMQTRLNFYANFWASRVIRDFEERLLGALKRKLSS